MAEEVVPVDIGCNPSPSGAGEIVVDICEGPTIVMFMAVTTTTDGSGHLRDLGVAYVECVNCRLGQFGYPNDEGSFEHRLWTVGLEDNCGNVCEVLNSSWLADLEHQMMASFTRIWAGMDVKLEPSTLRHFIFPFKESTFECIANDLRVTILRDYTEAMARLGQAALSS